MWHPQAFARAPAGFSADTTFMHSFQKRVWVQELPFKFPTIPQSNASLEALWEFYMVTSGDCYPEATQKQNCRYHDVAEYLNISSNKDLFLYTIPLNNWEKPIEVQLDFTLVSILSVQEKLQVVTFYFWMYVFWDNEFVSWNPLDFCNITNITLPVNLFWTPDLYIDERADEDKFTQSPFAYVSADGSIQMFQAYRLTSSCSLDVHAFPFDQQKCNISIMSSIHSDKEMIMVSNKSSKKANQDSRKNYLTSGEWKFEELRIIEHIMEYDLINFSAVTYEISMKRRSILYVLVLILPTLTLFLLDMAISVASASPGEKIAFKMTLILQISFLSMILNDMLPATSDNPPVIAAFFTGMFVFLVLGILENAFVLYLREKRPKLPSFKGNKLMNRILSKKKEECESPATHLGKRGPKENQPADGFPLPAKDSEDDSLVFLKHLNMELQQIKKHLSLEERQDDPESVAWDKTMVLVEKGLYYTRLILSVIFLAVIIIQWTR
uniref:5-hydroxytryptamine receptor 3A-like n=1 Tax=Podarcis muralis TaxID=64176 RepID=UPI0010A03FA1|nr:5-hydroxytryptamine receptor 3A-like [Podarcis muralis]